MGNMGMAENEYYEKMARLAEKRARDMNRPADPLDRIEEFWQSDQSLEWTPELKADVLALVEIARAARKIEHEYTLWSEDASDGEFRLWDLDRLVMAIVRSREALARLDKEGA